MEFTQKGGQSLCQSFINSFKRNGEIIIYYPYLFYHNYIFKSIIKHSLLKTFPISFDYFVRLHLKNFKIYLLFFDRILIGIEHILTPFNEYLEKAYRKLLLNQEYQKLLEYGLIIYSIWSGNLDPKNIHEVNRIYLKHAKWPYIPEKPIITTFENVNIYQRKPQKQSQQHASLFLKELRSMKSYLTTIHDLSNNKHILTSIKIAENLFFESKRYAIEAKELDLYIPISQEKVFSSFKKENLPKKIEKIIITSLKTAYYIAGEKGNEGVIVPSSLKDEKILRFTGPQNIIAFLFSIEFLENFLKVFFENNKMKLYETISKLKPDHIILLHREQWWENFKRKFMNALKYITDLIMLDINNTQNDIQKNIQKKLTKYAVRELHRFFKKEGIYFKIIALKDALKKISEKEKVMAYIIDLLISPIIDHLAKFFVVDPDYRKFVSFIYKMTT